MVCYGNDLEIMIRLFLMSGLALLGWKLFVRNEKQVPVKVLLAHMLFHLVSRTIWLITIP